MNTTAIQGYSMDQIRNVSDDSMELLPQRMKEIQTGMAETTGMTPDDIAMIYYGAYFYTALPEQHDMCSFLATSGAYTTDGTMVVSRNFDLPDPVAVFDPYYVLVVYKPTDGSNGVATFGPAGLRPETLFNSKGLFIADNNGIGSGGTDMRSNRVDYLSQFFRFMLDDSSTHALDHDIQATKPNFAVIVNAAGPDAASSYEETVSRTRQRQSTGLLVATNHFVDPDWGNLSMTEDSNSITRYNNLVNQATQYKGSIDAERTMEIRDVMLEQGGATVRHADFAGVPNTTDHQVVFVPIDRALWMKVNGRDWQHVDLGALFDQ
jgi:hypothetical protein